MGDYTTVKLTVPVKSGADLGMHRRFDDRSGQLLLVLNSTAYKDYNDAQITQDLQLITPFVTYPPAEAHRVGLLWSSSGDRNYRADIDWVDGQLTVTNRRALVDSDVEPNSKEFVPIPLNQRVPMRLDTRTKNAIDQLTRYGYGVELDAIADLLDLVTDINDDAAHGRHRSCLEEKIKQILATCEDLRRQWPD